MSGDDWGWLADAPVVPFDGPPRVLVVGLGSMGARRAAWLRDAGFEVLTADLDKGLAARYGRVVDLDIELLSRVPLAAAFVCTPPETHVALLRRLVKKTPAAFVEKPLAVDRGFVDTLLAETDKAGTLTMVGQTLRWHSELQYLKAAIDEGVLGTVFSVRAHFGHRLDRWAHPDPVGVYGNGALLDAGTHELDLVAWLVGEDPAYVVGVTARSGLNAMAAEDLAEVTLGFPSGAIATVHVDLVDTEYRRGLTVIGSDRTAHWEWKPDQEMYTRETQAFMAAAVGDEAVPADWPDLKRGADVLTWALTARQSDGRAVRL